MSDDIAVPESEWQSWESRWAKYLDSIAAEEQAATGESSDEDGHGPLPPSGMPGAPRVTPRAPGGFGQAAKARACGPATPKAYKNARPSAPPKAQPWECTFCGHHHGDPLPYCEACAKFRPKDDDDSARGGGFAPKPRTDTEQAAATRPYDVTDDAEEEAAPAEPETIGGVKPRNAPRRPRPPSWTEEKQAAADAAAEQRSREWQEKQRQEREKRRAEADAKAAARAEEARRRQEAKRAEEEERSRERQSRFHRGGRRAAPPATASPRTAPKGPPPIGRFFESFKAFDAAYVEWEAGAAAAEVVKLAEVPFPPRLDPAGLVESGLLRGGDESKRKKLLRSALLRWHPDKWMALTGKICAEERAELARRLSTITQELVEQKDLAQRGGL
jgi:hypothetical protein